ncbi:hypothetical protein ACTG0T_04145 [Halococcus morrhuae DSM 1307]|nr:hypothetical protein [Halococcus morrhuae]
MDQHRSMPYWWRYWNFGVGLLLLVATGALYVLFDPPTAPEQFELLLFVLATLLFFLSGLEIQFSVGARRIRERQFVAAAQLLLGVALLWSPAVSVLEQGVEPYDVVALASGLFMLLIGFGTIYSPAVFGPYDSAD